MLCGYDAVLQVSQFVLKAFFDVPEACFDFGGLLNPSRRFSDVIATKVLKLTVDGFFLTFVNCDQFQIFNVAPQLSRPALFAVDPAIDVRDTKGVKSLHPLDHKPIQRSLEESCNA